MYIVYSVISSTGSCRHYRGGFPYSCLTDLPDCENKCTSLSPCIAYGTNETHCALIPSERLNCSAIEMSLNDGNIATSSNNLVSRSNTGFNCSKIVIGEG